MNVKSILVRDMFRVPFLLLFVLCYSYNLSAQKEGTYVKITADSKYVEQFKRTEYWKKKVVGKEKEKVTVKLYFLDKDGNQISNLRSIKADFSTGQLKLGVFEIRIWENEYLDKVDQMKESFKIDFFQQRGNQYLFQIYVESCIIEVSGLDNFSVDSQQGSLEDEKSLKDIVVEENPRGYLSDEDKQVSENLNRIENQITMFRPSTKEWSNLKKYFYEFKKDKYDPSNANIKNKYKERIIALDNLFSDPKETNNDENILRRINTLRTAINELAVKKKRLKEDFEKNYGAQANMVEKEFKEIKNIISSSTYDPNSPESTKFEELEHDFDKFKSIKFDNGKSRNADRSAKTKPSNQINSIGGVNTNNLISKEYQLRIIRSLNTPIQELTQNKKTKTKNEFHRHFKKKEQRMLDEWTKVDSVTQFHGLSSLGYSPQEKKEFYELSKRMKKYFLTSHKADQTISPNSISHQDLKKKYIPKSKLSSTIVDALTISEFPVSIGNSKESLVFVDVNPGPFKMGISAKEYLALLSAELSSAATYDFEKTSEQLRYQRMAYSFLISKHEITNEQFKALIKTHKYDKKEANYPVTGISYEAMRSFCNELNKQLKDVKVDLPTEREWEYAARYPYESEGESWYTWAGRFDSLKTNISGKVLPVGKKPNGVSWCGAEDMIGNVAEICHISDEVYMKKKKTEKCVARGGAYIAKPLDCRVTTRHLLFNAQEPHFGFRVVIRPKDQIVNP